MCSWIGNPCEQWSAGTVAMSENRSPRPAGTLPHRMEQLMRFIFRLKEDLHHIFAIRALLGALNWFTVGLIL